MVNNKQALQNMDKELATLKAQNLKLQIDNKYLVAKCVEAEKAIQKAEVLQQKYNELNQVHFKSCKDLKA